MSTEHKAPTKAGYGYGDTDAEAMTGPGVWLHVPPRGHLKAVILQIEPYRYTSHWIRGKYNVCHGNPSCGWCAIGIGTKVRYVYCMYDTDRKRTGLLEVGPEAAGQVRDAVANGGPEPGLLLRFTKAGQIVNGAIRVELMHDFYRRDTLPPAIDIERVLQSQWSTELPENPK